MHLGVFRIIRLARLYVQWRDVSGVVSEDLPFVGLCCVDAILLWSFEPRARDVWR